MIVIGVMAILMGVAIPAVKGIMKSLDSSAGARPLINAALSAARSIAVREQTYAGIRFQDDAAGDTYITFIVHDPDAAPDGTGLANGFRAVIGRSPMKLPDDTGVLESFDSGLSDTDKDNLIRTAAGLTDRSTFSVVFSPAGRLTVHPVQVRNKDGYYDGHQNQSNDTIFNIKSRVDGGIAMFYQDDYPNPYVAGMPDMGLKEENSQREFILYSKKDLKLVPSTARYTRFFNDLRIEHISSYTGELVMEYREKKP